MTIPLWLPWAILVALVAVALPRPESPLRTWGPAAVALLVAAALTVDHLWVTQDELTEAVEDAAAAVDGSVGGVSQDRIRIETEDRLGHAVTVEKGSAGSGGDDPGEISYGYVIRVGDDGPSRCVDVTELPLGSSSDETAPTRAIVVAGACT